MMAFAVARSYEPATGSGLAEPLLGARSATPPPPPNESMHAFEPFCSLVWNFSDALFRSFTPDEAFQRKIK
jgi:hypothetical protein